MQYFKSRSVFITGGSSGIGLALAHQLVAAGAHVWIAARGQERLQAAITALQAKASPGQRVGGLSLDVADRAAVAAAVPQVLEGLGGLDILVNNAGIAHPGYLHEIPDDIFDAMMQVNYFGVVNVTRAFLPHFMQQRSGHVANVSSAAGYLGIFGYAAYTPSKFAVSGFSDCLRQDLKPYGIRVSVLFPADTDTPQFQAENLIKPAETAAIAGTIKPQSADEVALTLMKGMAAGRYAIVPGLMNKLTWYAVRLAPWLVRLVIDGDLMKASRVRNSTPQ